MVGLRQNVSDTIYITIYTVNIRQKLFNWI